MLILTDKNIDIKLDDLIYNLIIRKQIFLLLLSILNFFINLYLVLKKYIYIYYICLYFFNLYFIC